MIYVLNVGRIASVETSETTLPDTYQVRRTDANTQFRQVTIEITKERNAIERCMVHFAHFEKRTEYDESSDKYSCTIHYNVMDETEVLIRVLSFGPTIKVLGPEEFVREIKNRVKRQTELIGGIINR